MPNSYPILYYNDNSNSIDLQVNVFVQSMASKALCDEVKKIALLMRDVLGVKVSFKLGNRSRYAHNNYNHRGILN